MNDFFTAYPVANKKKAFDICDIFMKGSGSVGSVVLGAKELGPGAAFFYGVDESNVHLWKQVKSEGRPYYYCDNAYFDSTRQAYFRVTKDRLQNAGVGFSTCARFNALGISIKSWQENGDHIVVCPQSDSFMRNVIGFNGDWCNEITHTLGTLTTRPVRVRAWQRDKTALAATLSDDLKNAHALITWSSAAAITAILNGIPVVTGPCAASVMSGELFQLNALPRRPRETWAGVLADNQWTLEEFTNGTAWKMLHE